MRSLRAISPVIATVIILAVTIAIAIAVVGWVTGLFGATTSGTATLQILSDSYIYNCSEGTYVVVHVRNTGSATAHIYKIEVRGVGMNATRIADLGNTFEGSRTNLNNIVSATTDNVAVAPGEDKYVGVLLSDKYVSPGTIYTIYVYIKESGTPLSTTIVAQTCPS